MDLLQNYRTKLHLDFNISYKYYGSTFIPNKVQSAPSISVNSHSVWDKCSTGHFLAIERPFHTPSSPKNKRTTWTWDLAVSIPGTSWEFP